MSHCKELLDYAIGKVNTLYYELDKLEEDNLKLRGKVEANIPVERIDGLDEKLDSGYMKLSSCIGNPNQFATLPSIKNFGVSKEEHEKVVKQLEALKKEVHSLQLDVDLILDLKKQVAELEKRPYIKSSKDFGEEIKDGYYINEYDAEYDVDRLRGPIKL